MRYAGGRSAAGRGNGGGDFDYDIFADLFRGRGDGGNFRMPPQDVRYTLEIDFLDAVNGTHKMVAMPDGKTLDITIPAGINDGRCSVSRGRDCRAPTANRGTPTSRSRFGRTPVSSATAMTF